MYPNRKTRGFTLVELMVTIAIMGVMAAIAMPSMTNFIANSRIKNRADQVATLFRFAKGEAVRLNAPVLVCGTLIRSDGRPSGVCDSGNLGNGMMAFADQNRNGTFDGNNVDLLLRTIAINNSGNARVRVGIGSCNLAGTCGTTAATEFAFMPNGMFGIRSGNAALTAMDYLSGFDFSSRSLRVAVSDINLPPDDTRRLRYVLVGPSGSVGTCSHGGSLPGSTTTTFCTN